MKRVRLFARIPKPTIGQYGIAVEDIARVQVDTGVVEEVIECLQSDDELDVTFGLYFAECLRPRADFVSVSGTMLLKIATLIRNNFTHPSPRVREDAVRAFVAFRSSYEDYTTAMREFLQSPQSQIRRTALRAAPTFLSSKELEVLLPFRDDPEFGETGGMGGPLRYDLRDLALEIAERIAGRQFLDGDCSERRAEQEISWRNWRSFTQWLEGKKKWRLLGS